VWIVLNAKSRFGINFKRVIMCGDSAGGNLIIAMTLMAVNRKFRVPDAIFPFYPSTVSSREKFWPSLINSMDDPLLSYSMLYMISKSYGPTQEEHAFLGSTNQYMSPGLCSSDETLA
jgi:hormone-sensitive lipase